jgi:hypothetical protein
MTSRKDANKSLIEFTDDIGIPERLVTDHVMEFTRPHTEFVKEAWRKRIHYAPHIRTRQKESEPCCRVRDWISIKALENFE